MLDNRSSTCLRQLFRRITTHHTNRTHATIARGFHTRYTVLKNPDRRKIFFSESQAARPSSNKAQERALDECNLPSPTRSQWSSRGAPRFAERMGGAHCWQFQKATYLLRVAAIRLLRPSKKVESPLALTNVPVLSPYRLLLVRHCHK